MSPEDALAFVIGLIIVLAILGLLPKVLLNSVDKERKRKIDELSGKVDDLDGPISDL